MIIRIWGLKTITRNGSAELLKREGSEKFKMNIYVSDSPAGFEPTPGTYRQVNQRT